MSDFGVQATSLSEPQGAGSSPIAPVQQPGFQGVDVGGFGGLFAGLRGKGKAEEPWMAMRNEYAKKLSGIQEAELTGAIDSRRALNKMKQLTVEYQARGSDFGVKFNQSIADTYNALKTGTNIEDIQEVNKADAKRSVDAASELQKVGVYVPPMAEQSPADRDFIVRQESHINKLNATAADSQKAIEWQQKVAAGDRAGQEFQWKQGDEARKRDARTALSGMQTDALGYLPQLLDNIRKKGGTPQEQQMAWEQSIAGLQSAASNVLIGDAASLRNYQDTLQPLMEMGRKLLDPADDVKEMEDALKKRILTEQLRLTTDPSLVRVTALDRLMPNSPAVTMAASQAAQRAVMDDLTRSVTAGIVPSMLVNDQPTQKLTFQTITDTVNTAVGGKSTDANADFDAAGKAANSVLTTMGMINTSSNTSLAPAMKFISSPALESLVKQGKISGEAAGKARDVFQQLYLTAVGERFDKAMGAPVGYNPVGEGGKTNPNAANLGRIIDFEVGVDGSVKAVKKISPNLKINGSNVAGVDAPVSTLYIDRTVREAQKIADGITEVVRAATLLDLRTDYQQYWEENKHLLLKGVYPPPEYIEEFKKKGYIGTGSALNPANYRKPDATDSK